MPRSEPFVTSLDIGGGLEVIVEGVYHHEVIYGYKDHPAEEPAPEPARIFVESCVRADTGTSFFLTQREIDRLMVQVPEELEDKHRVLRTPNV
jgi:hypothetical protein